MAWGTPGYGQSYHHWQDQLTSAQPDTVQHRALRKLAEWWMQADFDSAYAYAQQALRLSERMNSPTLQVKSLHLLADIHQEQGQHDLALTHHQQGLARSQRAGQAELTAYAYYQLGQYHQRLSNYPAALERWQQAQDRALSVHDRSLLARIAKSMGDLYLDMDQPSQADSAYRQAQALWETLGDQKGLGVIAYARGRLAVRQNAPQQARTWFETSIEHHQQARYPYGQTEALLALGNVWLALGEASGSFGRADSLFRLGLQQARANRDSVLAAQAYNSLAVIADRQADFVRCIAWLDSGLRMMARAPSDARYYHPLTRELRLNLARAYGNLDRDAEGFIHLQHYVLINNHLLDQEKVRAVAEMEARYRNEQEKRRLAEDLSRTTLLSGALGLLLVLLAAGAYLLQQRRKQRHRTEVDRLLQEREQIALRAMLRGQARAQKRISKELHDHVGMLLATVKLHFETLADKLDSRPEQLNSAGVVLDKATQAVRGYSHQLYSGTLQQFGLMEALQELADDISRSEQVRVRIESHQMANADLPDSLAHDVYRIVQELLSNVLRHAKASSATIQLTRRRDGLNLIVSDDGSGFEVNKGLAQQGLGLRSVAARVGEWQGSYHFDSHKGHGTQVVIDIPWPPQDAPDHFSTP